MYAIRSYYGYLLKRRISGDAGQDGDSSPLQYRLDEPEVTCDVIFADQIDVVIILIRSCACSDDLLKQHVTGTSVAEVLRAYKARSIYRDDPSYNFV